MFIWQNMAAAGKAQGLLVTENAGSRSKQPTAAKAEFITLQLCTA
jgi:hypothetical protein